MDEFDAWSDATEQLFTERDVESAAEALGLDDQLAKGRDQFTFDRLLPADLAAAVISDGTISSGWPQWERHPAGWLFRPKQDQQDLADETGFVHPNLYVAGIGRTGVSKTPILNV